MEYIVDTCGLVIGLLDNNSEMPSTELFEEEFKKDIFGEYRKEVVLYGGEIDEDIFRPVGYHLLGDCNMAILSLIDDFAFPNRVMHAGHGYSTDNDGKRKYSLQIINGIHTRINEEDKKDGFTLKERAKDTFLRTHDRFPFIGIINYKINNSLLIGNGTELLELLKRKLYRLKETVNYDIKLICIDSFSNNELVVVCFARKLSSISFFTNETRILKLKDLVGEDEEAYGFIGSIARHSLLFQSLYYSTQEKNINEAAILEQVKDAHILATSFSYLGYEMQPDKCLKQDEEQLAFQFQWDLKPGHYIDFKETIKNKNIFNGQYTEERIMPGTDMMQLIVKGITFSQLEILNKRLDEEQSLKAYIRKQRINVIFNQHGLQHEVCNAEKHPALMKRLRNCGFSHVDLNQLRKDLDACHVSKVLKERTLKMYGTFNNGITDLLFFNYFIELKGYLENIRKRIGYYRQNIGNGISLEDFHTWINRMIRNFEQAYFNRFHHNSRILNISDFNLEYNGGIQQLISAYDAAYKIILRKLIHGEANSNCVYVSGYERVSSDKDSLRINISHITYPELYAATIWKEAMNFYWSTPSDVGCSNLFQININKNQRLLVDEDDIRMLRSRILYNKGYNPESYVHTLLYNSINKTFIHYLMADAFVFNIGYMGDFNTFTFWYWHYFLQMSHFYNHEGEMQPESFIKFLIRWLFIKHFAKDAADDYQDDYIAFDPTIAELWNCHIYEVSTFIKILLDELEKFDFINHVEAEAASLVFSDLGLKEQGQKLDEEQIRQLGQTLKAYKQALEKGKVITRKKEEESDFSFIRNLMYCYLKCIKDMNPSDKHMHVLERDDRGKIQQYEQYSTILADPLGGMFIHKGTQRGQYFKFRSVFYKTLWGVSCQIKKDYLK